MMNNLAVRGFALSLGVLLLCVFAGTALAADSLTVTRSNGIVDTFAVIPCPSGCAAGVVKLYHMAIANNGAGPTYTNDWVGTEPGPLNLICAGWITSTTSGTHPELHVFAYDQSGGVLEWIWGNDGVPTWTGPIGH